MIKLALLYLLTNFSSAMEWEDIGVNSSKKRSIVWENPDGTKISYNVQEGQAQYLDSKVCQDFLGYQFFDFKELDMHMRDASNSIPGMIKNEKYGDFTFKMCQSDWKLLYKDADYMDRWSYNSKYCSDASQAFYADAKSHQCVTSFSYPSLKGLHKVSTSKKVDDKFDGYQVKWTSDKDCTNSSKYEYTLNVLCDKQSSIDNDWKHFTWSSHTQTSGSQDKCHIVTNYYGSEGCAIFDLNAILKPIFALQGVIEIILGLVITFAGGYSFYNTIKLLIFILSSSFLFEMLYNTRLFFMGLNEGKTTILVLLFVTCALIGVIVACLIGRLVKTYSGKIIGATLGTLIAVLVLYPTDLPSVAKYMICVVTGILGMLLMKKMGNAFIIVITSCIGAILLFHGIDKLTGKVMQSNLSMYTHYYQNPLFWFFLLGVILLTGAGTLIQYKYFPMDELTEFTQPPNQTAIMGTESLIDSDEENEAKSKEDQFSRMKTTKINQ